ncbi:Hypothetical protein A7982_08470 [Minicystis rosea]|nr:Hypothetical protein A7982_08470 [Minicystis rosea]
MSSNDPRGGAALLVGSLVPGLGAARVGASGLLGMTSRPLARSFDLKRFEETSSPALSTSVSEACRG